MPPTLDATVGGAAANSYLDLTAANAYFANRLNAEAWATSDDLKKQALIQATARIDAENFLGMAATAEQRLKWPRLGVHREYGDLYLTTEIPRPIADATCELALAYLSGTDDPLAATGLEAYTAVTIGPLNVQLQRRSADALPDFVLRLLSPLLGAGSSGTVRLLRG